MLASCRCVYVKIHAYNSSRKLKHSIFVYTAPREKYTIVTAITLRVHASVKFFNKFQDALNVTENRE